MSGALNHSPADIIRKLLVDLSVGSLPSLSTTFWPIYVARTPDTPDSVITITDVESVKNGRVMVNGEVQEHHGIQIAVRDPDFRIGYDKAREVAITLDETVYLNLVSMDDSTGTGTSTYLVQSASRVGGVISAGKDVATSKRNLFTINAVVSLRQQ